MLLPIFSYFNHAFLIRVLIRSGNPEHPSDIIQNATLQIKSAHTEKEFINLGLFVDGFANALIPSELNPIEEVRIKFVEGCTHWIIISEVN